MKANNLNPDSIKRINKALEFIDQNIDTPLNLETLSAVAHYSPFHFHRLFKAVTSETLTAYLNRKRIEKSAAFLIRNEKLKIADVYTKIGFDSNSSFTKTFKKIYGLSPSQFKKNSLNRFTKIEQINSNNGQKKVIFHDYLSANNNYRKWLKTNGVIAIKEMPALKLVCITNIGESHLPNSFQKLTHWVKRNDLTHQPDFKMLTIYHDSYKITHPSKIKTSVCAIVNEFVHPDGEVSLKTITEGRFVVGSFTIAVTEFEKAWSSLFIWINDNGYQKNDRDCFEIYHNDFRQHPEQKSIVDLYIPIN